MNIGSSISGALVGLAERVQQGVVQVSDGGQGAGAGIVWGRDGQILTNYHVVAHARRGVQVLLADNRRYAARLVAQEPSLDLALLQVEARDLPALPVGDSERLRVGDWVFAIGHPWGQRGVVTTGIVSGVGRVRLRDSEGTSPFLRSSVALAPGNSGGPLLDARGEVVGVNSMIFGGDLAISIPSHVASEWMASLTPRGVVLGVEGQPVPPRLLHGGQLCALEVNATRLFEAQG